MFTPRVRPFTPAGVYALCTALPLSQAIRHARSQLCCTMSNRTLPTLVLWLCLWPEKAKLDCCICREYYTIDHLTRLKQFEARTPYNEAKCSDYCKDYHVQPCRACTTCHFCRYASYLVTVVATFLTVTIGLCGNEATVAIASSLRRDVCLLLISQQCYEG